MTGTEITVPKELREFMPAGARETTLGYRKGAKKQYRYGNLHIREYDDKFLVHTDRVDPRKDAIGHLLHDAPEVLAGLACAVTGAYAARKLRKSGPSVSEIVTPILAGYLGYVAAKKTREFLEKRHVKP